jgi:hypothetical protein
MDYKQAEVCLSINLQGQQAIRGRYTYYHRKGEQGQDISSAKIDRAPEYCKSFKTVRLGNEFVNGALAEPPSHYKMRPEIWKKFPEKKRLDIHINSYIQATVPEYRSFTVEIL